MTKRELTETEYENWILKTAALYNLPKNNPPILTDTEFYVGCPAAWDPLNKILAIKLNWGEEDKYYSYQSYLYKQFESALKTIDDFFNFQPIKNWYISLDIYARVIVVNMADNLDVLKKQMLLQAIKPYIYEGINLKQASSKQSEVTNEAIANKFIVPATNWLATLEQTLKLNKNIDLDIDENEIIYEVMPKQFSEHNAKLPILFYEKLENIAKYIDKCCQHIDSDTLAAFKMIYNYETHNQPIIFSTSLSREFIDIVWNIMLYVNDLNTLIEDLINLTSQKIQKLYIKDDGQFLVFEDDLMPDDEISGSKTEITGELNG